MAGRKWNHPNELKEQYRNASILTERRVIFNIHGNSYRLIVDIEYRLKIVFVVWFGIKFRLEQMGMSEGELSDILGHRSRKSEILSGKRKLNLSMIRKLSERLHIPAEVLIQAY